MNMNQAWIPQIDQFLSAHRENIVEDLFTLARIPSVQGEPAPGKPYGEECARALDAALELCRAQGMTTENMDYYCGSALWKGETAGDGELGFVAHLDVVPAGEGWSGEPFVPFLRDGYAIGRGVRDNKNGAIAGLYAVRCIRELGIPMRHAVRIIFGCAEETGMDDLPHYLERRAAPSFSIVPDTAFPVCHGEKGIYTADFLVPVGEELTSFSGGLAANVVPDKARAVIRAASGAPVTVEAAGVSSHASRPEGSKNAVRELAVRLLAEYAHALSPKTAAAMRFIAGALSDCWGEKLGIAAQDAQSGKLTCICGLARLEAGAVRMSLNIRYPVTHDGKLITEGLQKFAEENAVTFVFDDDDKPNYLPADHPGVRMLTEVYAGVTGKESAPYVMGGGTYARHLPNAVAFGPDFPGEEVPCPEGHGDCHEPDECQSIQGLIDAVKIYVCALIELDAMVD